MNNSNFVASHNWIRKYLLKIFTRSLVAGRMLTLRLLVLTLQLISSYKKECRVPEKHKDRHKKCNEIWTKKGKIEYYKMWNIYERASSQKILYLKKFIILTFESASISVVPSNACCMWCNHLSAAWCVTGNGRWRAIRAGWPAKHI